ncbi:MAG: hypothetical protein QW568_02555 [Candidatus Anstonellaceae archaeon]
MDRAFRRGALAAILLFLLLPLSAAENYVAINSNDGRDVLSGIFYANVKGLPVRFVPVPSGNAETFAAKVGGGHDILLVQSTNNAASGFAESSLRSKGNDLEIYSSPDPAATNLDLAKRSGAQSFIIVDSAFSDSAISALPYAAQTKSYIIFADKSNIDAVKEVVRGKKITIYGYVDKDVKSKLADLSPATIGRGEDKYEDNIALVEKLMSDYPSSNRPILTDGTMIEDAIAAGDSPVILTGRLVPQVTYNFVEQKLREGKIAGILLVSNELAAPAYDMRERIRRDLAAEGSNKTLSVLVKFAQAIPSTQSGVLGLDLFRVPAYVPKLSITEIVYNKEGKKFMVGLENTGEGPLYYTLEAKITVNGKEFRTFGTSSAKLIERGNSQGEEFALDLSSVEEGAVESAVIVKYGGSQKSLDAFATSQGKLAAIEYVDDSNVTVRSAKYDKNKELLKITLKNGGKSAAYAFTKVTLKDEDGAEVTVSAPAIRELAPSSLQVEEIPLGLSQKEIELNREFPVSVEYGGRRGFLVKQATYTVQLEEESGSQLSPELLGIFAAALVLIALYAIYTLAFKKKAK